MTKSTKIMRTTLLVMATLLVIATISHTQNFTFEDIVKKNTTKYEQWTVSTYMKLKHKAEKDLWDKPYQNARWFTDKFWPDRNNEKFIEAQLKTYLFPSDAWEDYLFSTIAVVELEVDKMAKDILMEANIIKSNDDVVVNVPIGVKELFTAGLPTADDIVKSIYSKLEAEGVNTVPESQIQKAWERYVAKYPKTTLTLTAFTALAAGLLTKNPYVGVGTFAVLSGVHASIHEKKEKYHAVLIGAITENKDRFNNTLKQLIFKTLEGTQLYFKDQGVVHVKEQGSTYPKP